MAIFTGSGVAIVTPFNADMSINYEAYTQLLDFQIENKTDAIIVAGTTGEASTLTDEEQIELIQFTVQHVNGRIPVIAGSGSNDTRHGIELAKEIAKYKVDGLLSVTPYYNKTSQRGLIAHYTALADATNLPTILYTVPGRCGMKIELNTLKTLSEHPNIVGIKDATGDLTYSLGVKQICGPNFDLYSGNDDVNIPVLSVGGIGIISVLANIAPAVTHQMIHNYLNGKTTKAAQDQQKYLPLIQAIFKEVNPIPIKAALFLMGYETEHVRLPLIPAEEATIEHLKTTLKNYQLI